MSQGITAICGRCWESISLGTRTNLRIALAQPVTLELIQRSGLILIIGYLIEARLLGRSHQGGPKAFVPADFAGTLTRQIHEMADALERAWGPEGSAVPIGV